MFMGKLGNVDSCWWCKSAAECSVVWFCDVVLKRFLHSDVSVKCVQAYLSGKRVLFGLVIFNY